MTSQELRTPYPEIDPFDTGMLSVGDGNEIYFEQSGNPEGKPVVFMHGGPGCGSQPADRRMFDPQAYRIVLFDQRGCGKSRPHVADGADLSTNTTWALVADIEKLREHLNTSRWQVFGGSWGTTLGLAYAQSHPERVSEIILCGVFLCRPLEIDWFYRGGAGHIFPEAWQEYAAACGAAAAGDGSAHFTAPGFDHVGAYYEMMHSEDPETALGAARAWTNWDMQTCFLVPESASSGNTETGEDDRFALAFARIENHYLHHDAFLSEQPLLEGVSKVAHLPCVIVHGRYDVVCPVTNAVELAAKWPGAQLHISPEAGHAMAEPVSTHYLIEATDAFRNR